MTIEKLLFLQHDLIPFPLLEENLRREMKSPSLLSVSLRATSLLSQLI